MAKNSKWKYKKSRYMEVALPLTKITKTGGCLAIIIPKPVATKYGLEAGDKVTPTIMKRVWSLSDEITDKDFKELQEQIEYEKDKQEAMEKARRDMKL